jgi:predicted transcriptional regulator
MVFENLLSFKKMGILLNLLSREYRISEMAKELSLSKSSISYYVNELQKLGFIERTPRIKLTNTGKILAHQFQLLKLNWEFLNRDVEFWNEHDLESIPEHMLLRISELGNYRIVKSGKAELLKYLQYFRSTVSSASFVRVVSSVLLPECVSVLSRISRDAEVSMLISDDVLSTLSEHYSSELTTLLENGVEIYVIENLRILCLVTDRAICLGLYFKSGEFDIRCGLFSHEKSAISWGLDLFEMLKSKSTPAFG